MAAADLAIICYLFFKAREHDKGHHMKWWHFSPAQKCHKSALRTLQKCTFRIFKKESEPQPTFDSCLYIIFTKTKRQPEKIFKFAQKIKVSFWYCKCILSRTATEIFHEFRKQNSLRKSWKISEPFVCDTYDTYNLKLWYLRQQITTVAIAFTNRSKGLAILISLRLTSCKVVGSRLHLSGQTHTLT